MQRKKNVLDHVRWTGVMTFIVFTPVSAGGFDGSSNLVCGAIDVVACTEGTACSGHDFLTPRALSPWEIDT